MSDEQVRHIEAFAAAGGSVIATGETGGYGAFGDPRTDFALAGLFGVHRARGALGGQDAPGIQVTTSIRATPICASRPKTGVPATVPRTPPPPRRSASAIPSSPNSTARSCRSAAISRIVGRIDAGVDVLATLIPDYPMFPPETSWMRQPYTTHPCITVREQGNAKLVWFVADVDRCYARDQSLEHALLIANAVRAGR